MGMFDYVECKANLPNSKPMDGLFQTKDLGNYLGIYTIESDGKLMEFNRHQVCFSGVVNFYGNEKMTGRWKEYQAEFINGVMESVKEIKND